MRLTRNFSSPYTYPCWYFIFRTICDFYSSRMLLSKFKTNCFVKMCNFSSSFIAIYKLAPHSVSRNFNNLQIVNFVRFAQCNIAILALRLSWLGVLISSIFWFVFHLVWCFVTLCDKTTHDLQSIIVCHKPHTSTTIPVRFKCEITRVHRNIMNYFRAYAHIAMTTIVYIPIFQWPRATCLV